MNENFMTTGQMKKRLGHRLPVACILCRICDLVSYHVCRATVAHAAFCLLIFCIFFCQYAFVDELDKRETKTV